VSENSAAFTLGGEAPRTSIKVPTIRYYEEIGLLPSPGQLEGNCRWDRDGELGRLTFIRRANWASIAEKIAQLTPLRPEWNDCLKHVSGRVARCRAIESLSRAVPSNRAL
jgi:hypothetical protein